MAGYIGSKAVNLSTTGADINGDANIDGDLSFRDNDKIKLGDGSDLQIYHNANNSYVQDVGTGKLHITSNGTGVSIDKGTSELMATFDIDGAVTLYHDNAAKLATTSTGCDITGILTSDGLTVNSGTNNTVAKFESSDAGAFIILEDSGSTNDGNRIAVEGDVMSFATGDSEAMRIDSSGRVMVGTTTEGAANEAEELTIAGTGGVGMTIRSTDSGTSRIYFSDGTSGTPEYAGYQIYNHSDNAMIFGTNASERMRIDSSGRLLVGKTAQGLSTAGFEVEQTGQTSFTQSGASCIRLNRLSSDGDIIQLRKDTSQVGSIGANGGALFIGGTDNNYGALRFNNSPRAIVPAEYNGNTYDNSVDLGQSAVRFDDIYATNGTIQTSDRNEKQDIAELTDAEQRVAVAAKGLLRKFRWRDAVTARGDEARIHFGIIAQDLQAAFAAEGLDAGDYAMFISSTWTDEETGEERTRMGVRYSELLAFIIGAL